MYFLLFSTFRRAGKFILFCFCPFFFCLVGFGGLVYFLYTLSSFWMQLWNLLIKKKIYVVYLKTVISYYNWLVGILKGEDVILKFKDLHEQLVVTPSSTSYNKLVTYFCDSFKVWILLPSFYLLFFFSSPLSVLMTEISRIFIFLITNHLFEDSSAVFYMFNYFIVGAYGSWYSWPNVWSRCNLINRDPPFYSTCLWGELWV